MIIYRNKLEDYLSIRGLEARTGLPWNRLHLMLVKEPLDNALDAVEDKPEATVRVEVYPDTVIIEDNGNGIPRSSLEKIFDWSGFASSKYYIISPKRGELGDGSKNIVAYISAFTKENKLASDGYLRIRSRDYNFTISNVRYEGGRIVDDRVLSDASEREGTLVEIKLPAPLLDPEEIECLLLEGYVLFNPWVNFIVNGREYVGVSKFNVNKRSHIHYYTLKDFTDLLLKLKEECPEMKLKTVFKEIYGFDKRLLGRYSDMLVKNIVDTEIKEVYSLLRSSITSQTVSIGFIGRRPLKERIKQLYGEPERAVYKTNILNLRNYAETFEVLCAHSEEYQHRVITGINNSVPYINPLERYYLYVSDKSSESTKKVSLEELLRSCGINETEPAIVLAHMFLPKPHYLGYAKSIIDLTGSEAEIIGNLIRDCCRWYSGHKGYEGSYRVDMKQLIGALKPIVLQFYSQEIRVTSRQVFYLASPLSLYPFDRVGYRKVCKALLLARLRGVLPWDSIIDRSRYYIDPIPKYSNLNDLIGELKGVILSRLGFDPWKELGVYIEIWVEKDSIAEFVKPIAVEYLMVVAPSRGYTSWAYAYEGVKRIMNYGYDNNIILYLGDYDPSGFNIQEHLENAIKYFGVNCRIIRVAVTEQDIDYLKPSPLKKADPRVKKYKWYVEKHGDKVWELDAMNPVVLQERLRKVIKSIINDEKWAEIQMRSEKIRKKALEVIDKIIEQINANEFLL